MPDPPEPEKAKPNFDLKRVLRMRSPQQKPLSPAVLFVGTTAVAEAVSRKLSFAPPKGTIVVVLTKNNPSIFLVKVCNRKIFFLSIC